MIVECDVQDPALYRLRVAIEPHASEKAVLTFRRSAADDSWFFGFVDAERNVYVAITYPGASLYVLETGKTVVLSLLFNLERNVSLRG